MSVRSRIVLVVGDAEVRRRLRTMFEASGYSVEAVASLEVALRTLAQTAPEVVVYVPAPDRIDDSVALLRRATSAALIVLTPPTGETVVSALDAGADDAIPFPHPRAEVLARVQLALRRSRPSDARRVLRCGELSLDVESRDLHVGDRRVALTRLEYRLLEALLLAGDHAVRHDQLLEQVWGPAHVGRLHYLRVYVARLRRKIEAGPEDRLIISVPGIGYRLRR